MLNSVLLFLLVTVSSAEKARFENYKVFSVVPKSNEDLALLKQLDSRDGFTYWRDPSSAHSPADLMVAPDQLNEFVELMSAKNIKTSVAIENVQRLVDDENPVTGDSAFGWKKYHTLDEIYSWLDSIGDKYPDKVEVVRGGKTYQGRDIKGVKLSFGPNKPGVFIEGGIHAREWISPATVTYLIDQLLTSDDPEVRNLAESYDWYMFPSFNPDGYVYTHERHRFWRKTLSKHGDCQGTDANRNWDYEWMVAGASDKPCSDTYGGPSAFSEIETKSMSEYIKSIGDKLFAYISFHSYSQLLIIPYTYTDKHLENYNQTYAIGRKALKSLAEKHGTKYQLGDSEETVGYLASGSSMDWAKHTLKLPLAYTYELRPRYIFQGGFILPARQIIPNCEEILASLITMFKEAKKLCYPKCENQFGYKASQI